MSVIFPAQPAPAVSLPVPSRDYWRHHAGDLPAHCLAPPPFITHGRLQVDVTLGGDTYAQRHQAKAAGYKWARGQWHRMLSVAVRGDRPHGRADGRARLTALVSQETGPFGLWSVAEATYLPDVVAPKFHTTDADSPLPPNGPQLGSDLPIRLLTSLNALLTLLQRTPLVVLDKQPPLSARVLGREPRSGWCAAVSVLDTGMRFQLRRTVFEAALADGRIHEDAVWQLTTGDNPWIALYPMTSRWLEADQAGQVTLGRRLSPS